jgi:hypothetical protein
MSSRMLPLAVLGIGVFLAAGATLAVIEHAATPGLVFAALALVHVAVAAGLSRSSRAAAIVGGILGVVELIAVAIVLSFIVGIEIGIGLDLGDQWFAPLNGYATLVVAAVIVLVAGGLVRRAVRAIGASPVAGLAV